MSAPIQLSFAIDLPRGWSLVNGAEGDEGVLLRFASERGVSEFLVPIRLVDGEIEVGETREVTTRDEDGRLVIVEAA